MQYCWTPLLYSCILFVALGLVSLTEAGIIAKSTKNECVNYGGEADLKKKGGNPCKQKLVIALTVTADEVSHMVWYIVVALNKLYIFFSAGKVATFGG